MPLIDVEPLPYDFPTGQTRVAEPPPADDTAAWNIGDTVAAAFRQNNAVASFLSNKTLGVDNSIDPTFDVVKDIQGTKYEPYADAFVDALNPRYAAAIKQQIDMEEDDRKTLMGSGWAGTLAGIAGGVLDPSILIPYVGTAKKVAGGYSIAKGLLLGAGNAALGVAAQEAMLQGSQATRTAEESAVNIGFGVVLGGLVGSGAAALMSKAEQKAVQGAYDRLLATGGRNPGQPAGVGADAVWKPTVEDLTIAGTAANKVAAATQFNPVLRSNFRASAGVREAAQLLAENTVYQGMHAEGRTLGAAAETLARMESEAALARATTSSDDLFRNMRKAGVKMSRQDFEDAIGQALRNGDQGVNEFVTQAARAWREQVFDPFKNRAIEAGLLPEDVSIDTAMSYFSRRYDQEMMTAREQEFKARVMPVIEQQVREKFTADVERVNQRLADIDQQLADIKLSPEERAAVLADLEKQGNDLDLANVEQVEKWSEVTALRQQAKAAKESGDTVKAATLLKQAKDILDGAGDPLKRYLKARTKLRRRFKTVDLNFAGLEDRAQRIQQRLVDLEDRTQRGLQRLIARGRVAERKLSRMPSEEQLAAELDGMEQAFRDTLGRSEKAQQAHVEAIEKIREEGRARQLELEKQAKDLKTRAKEAKGKGDLKQPELEQRAYEARVKAAEAKTKAEERIIARIERMAQAEANRAGQLRRLTERIEAAKGVDLQAMREEVQRGIDQLVAETADTALARGERAQRLQEKLADLDPEKLKERAASLERMKREVEQKFYENWEQRHMGEGVSLGAKRAPAEPPPKAGMIRVYHSGSAGEGSSGRWVSSDRRYASDYRPDLPLYYLDLPANDARLAPDEFSPEQTVANGFTRNFELTPDEAARLQEIRRPDDPLSVGSKMEAEKGAARTPDFSEAARMVVDEVFDKITGRAVSPDGSSLPEYITPITRGPMKDRTFNVPDALLVGNRDLGETNFLIDNVREVGERYARIMSAEIELSRKGMLGKEWNMRIEGIRREYADLREAVANAATPEEARALLGQKPGRLDSFEAWRRNVDKGQATKERMLAFLRKDEQDGLEDLHALRDLVRGTYKAKENASDWGQLTRTLMAFNYIRLMGGAVLANFTEAYRPAMVHGFGAFFKGGIKPLIGNLDGMKLSVKEAQQAGLVTERVLQHRMMSLGEVADPYARNTALQRMLVNGSRVASKWNGLSLWTDTMKSVSSIMSQNRILEGAVGEKDGRFLAYLGIDKEMADRIAKQFVLYGETRDTIKVANTGRWDDEAAVRAYRAAFRKDVDSIIVTRGVGDVPLFANTPTGKLILQFRSFSLAAHQRATLRGLQESKARLLSGMVIMTSLGMMASALRAWRNGEQGWERWKNAAENPGFLIGEGLDLSGIFPVAFELANTTEKLTGGTGMAFNPIKTPLMAAFPGASQQGSSTRFATRDPLAAVLGPSAGLVTQVIRAAGYPLFVIAGEDPSKAQTKAAAGLIPFNSYLGMKELIQLGLGDSPYTQ